MRKLSKLIMITLVPLYLLSCNSGDTKDSASQETENPNFNKQWAKTFIDSINTRFSEQFSAGDSTALASHYWPDAALLLDNSEAVKGNDILNAWGAAMRMGIKELEISTTDITGDMKFIIETGNYEMKDEKKALIDKGKYVVVWEKRNNEWKIYRDIGSTSMPAAK